MSSAWLLEDREKPEITGGNVRGIGGVGHDLDLHPVKQLGEMRPMRGRVVHVQVERVQNAGTFPCYRQPHPVQNLDEIPGFNCLTSEKLAMHYAFPVEKGDK